MLSPFMDLRVADNLVSSNPATAASNNGGSLASEADADVNKLTLYGSAFLNTAAEDDSHAAKLARISSRGGDTPNSDPRQQMLSFSAFSSPPLSFPFVRSSSGYGCGSMNGVRGPFTSSQWMELEHQALIYKYITANVPIPSYLLIPIRKAFESSGISCFSLLKSNALGWGGFQLGFSKNDPEPGRCRRTDGKKWRCSRDAVADQKYCERHINRGRHRSRKHVEAAGTTTTTTTNPNPASSSGNRSFTDKETVVAAAAAPKMNQHTAYTSSEFGSVCSDSLLNPLSSSHALRHFIDEWPKSHSEMRSCTAKERSEFEEATKMGLGVGSIHSVASEQSQRHNYWVPASWEPLAGGPLGEALHATSSSDRKRKNKRALDFMETRLPSSSPLGVHRGESGDGASFCNGIISSSFVLPSLPAL